MLEEERRGKEDEGGEEGIRLWDICHK